MNEPGHVGSSELRSIGFSSRVLGENKQSLQRCRFILPSMFAGATSRQLKMVVESHVVDRLCQGQVVRVIDPRRVGCYFWVGSRSHHLLLSRDVRRSVVRIPLADNNHDFLPFVSVVSLSYLLSVSLLYGFTAAWMQGCCIEPERSACLRVRASFVPKPKKEILTRLLLRPGPHYIPCRPSHSTFLLARATAVVLALTPR